MHNNHHGLPEGVSLEPKASLAEFDARDYRPYLDGLDLNDDQAGELLRIVWDIMRMFVEMDMPAENWGQILGSVIEEPTPDPAEID